MPSTSVINSLSYRRDQPDLLQRNDAPTPPSSNPQQRGIHHVGNIGRRVVRSKLETGRLRVEPLRAANERPIRLQRLQYDVTRYLLLELLVNYTHFTVNRIYMHVWLRAPLF